MSDFNNIKMIVTDLDGTLLRGDKTISEKTKNVLTSLKKKGIPFGIATARPIRSVKNFLPFLTYDFAIYHNGAVVMDGGQLCSGFGIDDVYSVIKKLMEELPGAHICVEAEDMMYSSFQAEEIWPGFEYIATEDFHEVVGKIGDKIIIEATGSEQFDKIASIIPDNLYAQMSEGQVVMIMNKNATKINGIKLIVSRYGISLDDIVAFGDDYNDVCMLEGCGTGVATSNALKEVKQAADFVCASNEEDGEADWIQTYLL